MPKDTKKGKSKMVQISLKIPEDELEKLKSLAEDLGQTPLSFHIRLAISQYIRQHQLDDMAMQMTGLTAQTIGYSKLTDTQLKQIAKKKDEMIHKQLENENY
jgi:predicted DNA-binding protein